MLGSIGKFTKNRSGAFAMQFALMAVPLCVCTGLAIDGGRAFLARFELAAALDAAALAVGSTQDNEDADLDAIARKFVEMNFKTAHDDPIALELVEIGGEDEAMMLRGSVSINTFFMPLVGQPYVTVEAESEVRRGGANVEVALALDVTGSMNATRIAGLKSASKILIDEVVSTAQEPFFSKIAIVPWSQSVNIQSSTKDFVTATALADLRGTIRNSTTVTNVSWRNGATTTKSISAAGWRTNSGRDITNIAWRNGSALTTVTNITKTNSGTRIRIETSADTGFVNGETVVITNANGSYTSLNGNMYRIVGKTTSSPWRFNLYNVGTTTYATPPSGSTDSSQGTLQRCLLTDCTMRVTASSHGFATNDRIYIEDVDTTGTGSEINNTWGETWVVTNRDTNNFSLNGTFGPDFKTYDDDGTASECFNATCRFQVTTSAAHDFSSSDRLYMWGITETGSGTSLNTSSGTSFTAEDPSGSIFYLPGDGRNYRTRSSGGSVAECDRTDCRTVVTSTGHGLETGDKVELRNITGPTGFNYGNKGVLSDNTPPAAIGTDASSRRYWTITRLSDDQFTIDDSKPSLSSVSGTFTGTATAQCLEYGCARMYYAEDAASYMASSCIVERTGAQAYTDAAPSTSGLGILYTSDGTCDTDNYVTPMTSNKDRLNTAIDDLTTGGSTAGQLGIGWAWYMISPNFASVWDDEDENEALDYDSDDLVKVAVLMTDGEFNYSSCMGISDSTLSFAFRSANCDTSRDPFEQAEEICDNMKDAGITIYTVGLAINTSLYADDFLLACASEPAYAHLAADEAALEVAFKKIAQSISRLRVSK
jgi:Flp pilus assembly protein TadG